MKYKDTCATGSFVAWGAGFEYQYLADLKALKVSRTAKDYTLAHLKFDRFISKEPRTFVQSLDKANQIKALMLSNNATNRLSDTIDEVRLGPLIKSSAHLSRHVFDLNFKNYSRFSRQLTKEFGLKHFKIKRFMSEDEEQAFFVARLQTQHNNSICVRGCTMEGLLSSLSDRTVRDLITMEFGHQFEDSAYKLLSMSTKLSAIGNILDENYEPKKHVNDKSDFFDGIEKLH